MDSPTEHADEAPTTPFSASIYHEVSKYDPAWMQNNNIDQAVLQTFSSKIHLSALFSKGVLKVGDDWRLKWVSSTGTRIKMAKVRGIVRSCPTMVYPAGISTYFDQHVENRVLANVEGPYDIIIAASREAGEECIPSMSRKWQSITVFRDGKDLGTLWDIRQAFNHWQNLQDAEAVRTGRGNRRRRIPKNLRPVLAFRNGLLHHRLPDGSFVRASIDLPIPSINLPARRRAPSLTPFTSPTNAFSVPSTPFPLFTPTSYPGPLQDPCLTTLTSQPTDPSSTLATETFIETSLLDPLLFL